MDEIPLERDVNSIIEVFTISGQNVARMKALEFDDFWHNLPTGVYIVNGKKMIK